MKFKAVAGAIAAAVMTLAVTPAHANSSAAADIAAPLRAAQASRAAAPVGGDEKFRNLFNSWQSLESSKVPALAAIAEASSQAGLAASARGAANLRSLTPIPTVSIPSRMPVEGVRLTSNYGMREHPVLGGRRAHKGIDLAGPVGTPVYATADGVVSKAEWFSSYGLYVSIEHGGELQTRYGHMSRLNVANGQQVRKGDIIGFIGSTGRSTGPHLHYEVRVSGVAVNPLPYMQSETIAANTAHGATKQLR